MLTGAAVKKLLLAAGAAAAGAYALTPAKYLWDYGIHKPWPMEPFRVAAIDGTTLSSEECEGRPVLVVVWAAWCPYMPQNIRVIERIKSRYSSTDACIVPVSNDADIDKAWQFVRAQELMGPYYWSRTGLSAMYWGHAIPHSFVFDRTGRLVLSEDNMDGGYNGVMDAMDVVVHDGASVAAPSPTSPGHAPKPPAEEVETDEVARQVEPLYEAGDMDGLEALAKEWRRARARTSMDVWKEWLLYKQIVLDRDAEGASDADFEARIKYYEAWVAARPDSVVVRTALARQWYEYASKAIGNGKHAGAEAWRLDMERLNKSEGYLTQVQQMPGKTPVVYQSLLALSLAGNWPAANREELFREAIAFEPDYLPYYTSYAQAFEPQWGGSYDSLRAFVEQAAAGRGDGRGDELYARLVSDLNKDFEGDSINLFRHGFDWRRVLAGYRSLLAKNPGSVGWRLQCAKLAVLAGDRAVAREMFSAEGVRYASSSWGDYRSFIRDRRWALRAPTLWARLLSLIGLGGLA